MGPDEKELSFLHSSAKRIIFCPIWAKTHTSKKCDGLKDNGCLDLLSRSIRQHSLTQVVPKPDTTYVVGRWITQVAV